MQVPVELKLNYLKRRIQDIQKLRDSLEMDDYSYALKLGHQVKGNAVTFEFPHMTTIGVEMENAAKLRDKEQVRNLLTKMESAIQVAQNNMLH